MPHLEYIYSIAMFERWLPIPRIITWIRIQYAKGNNWSRYLP